MTELLLILLSLVLLALQASGLSRILPLEASCLQLAVENMVAAIVTGASSRAMRELPRPRPFSYRLVHCRLQPKHFNYMAQQLCAANQRRLAAALRFNTDFERLVSNYVLRQRVSFKLMLGDRFWHAAAAVRRTPPNRQQPPPSTGFHRSTPSWCMTLFGRRENPITTLKTLCQRRLLVASDRPTVVPVADRLEWLLESPVHATAKANEAIEMQQPTVTKKTSHTKSADRNNLQTELEDSASAMPSTIPPAQSKKERRRARRRAEVVAGARESSTTSDPASNLIPDGICPAYPASGSERTENATTPPAITEGTTTTTPTTDEEKPSQTKNVGDKHLHTQLDDSPEDTSTGMPLPLPPAHPEEESRRSRQRAEVPATARDSSDLDFCYESQAQIPANKVHPGCCNPPIPFKYDREIDEWLESHDENCSAQFAAADPILSSIPESTSPVSGGNGALNETTPLTITAATITTTPTTEANNTEMVRTGPRNTGHTWLQEVHKKRIVLLPEQKVTQLRDQSWRLAPRPRLFGAIRSDFELYGREVQTCLAPGYWRSSGCKLRGDIIRETITIAERLGMTPAEIDQMLASGDPFGGRKQRRSSSAETLVGIDDDDFAESGRPGFRRSRSSLALSSLQEDDEDEEPAEQQRPKLLPRCRRPSVAVNESDMDDDDDDDDSDGDYDDGDDEIESEEKQPPHPSRSQQATINPAILRLRPNQSLSTEYDSVMAPEGSADNLVHPGCCEPPIAFRYEYIIEEWRPNHSDDCSIYFVDEPATTSEAAATPAVVRQVHILATQHDIDISPPGTAPDLVHPMCCDPPVQFKYDTDGQRWVMNHTEDCPRIAAALAEQRRRTQTPSSSPQAPPVNRRISAREAVWASVEHLRPSPGERCCGGRGPEKVWDEEEQGWVEYHLDECDGFIYHDALNKAIDKYQQRQQRLYGPKPKKPYLPKPQSRPGPRNSGHTFLQEEHKDWMIHLLDGRIPDEIPRDSSWQEAPPPRLLGQLRTEQGHWKLCTKGDRWYDDLIWHHRPGAMTGQSPGFFRSGCESQGSELFKIKEKLEVSSTLRRNILQRAVHKLKKRAKAREVARMVQQLDQARRESFEEAARVAAGAETADREETTVRRLVGLSLKSIMKNLAQRARVMRQSSTPTSCASAVNKNISAKQKNCEKPPLGTACTDDATQQQAPENQHESSPSDSHTTTCSPSVSHTATFIDSDVSGVKPLHTPASLESAEFSDPPSCTTAGSDAELNQPPPTKPVLASPTQNPIIITATTPAAAAVAPNTPNTLIPAVLAHPTRPEVDEGERSNTNQRPEKKLGKKMKRACQKMAADLRRAFAVGRNRVGSARAAE
ncbi:hypothetical protein HDU96_007620 [Phlyctochytrium bullatum]|nr:hypothetical protein HDU96_007620 [Phlyctochytrium bullatum]